LHGRGCDSRLAGQRPTAEMSGRARLLVAYLLRAREEIEVDVLRRVLRSSEIGRIAPHITLVPPVNIAQARVSELSRQLEEAVTTVAPVSLWLRGAETFQPQQHVLYLPVYGELGELGLLRDRCRVGEFAVTERRPFVPHVTVKSHADGDIVASARVLLGAFECPIVVDRVTILERDIMTDRGVWEIRDEFVLASARTSGRGGREVVCSRATFANSDDQHLLVANGLDPLPSTRDDASARAEYVIVRARISGALIALCVIEVRNNHGQIRAFVVDGRHRNEGIGHQVLKYIEQSAQELDLKKITVNADRIASGFFRHFGFEDTGAPSRANDELALSRLF